VVEIENLSGWHLDGEQRAASDALQAELLEWAADLGARHVKVCADLSGAETEHDKLVEDFGLLCEAADGVGTTIALETMPLGAIKTPKDGIAIIEESGVRNAGVLLDVWHVARGGTDFHELRSLPGGRIASVELNDAAKVPVDGDPIKDGSDYRRVAGTGELGVEAFVEAVLATGYSGPFGDENLSIDFRARSLEDAARTSYQAFAARQGVDPAQHSRTAGSGSPDRARLPLSDRGELSASQLRVNDEAERIQQLALLHQPDQDRLPELSKLTAVRMPEQARSEDFQRERQVALTGKGGSGGDECVRLSPG
jgi:sugar phosphate isomerase/epimerase